MSRALLGGGGRGPPPGCVGQPRTAPRPWEKGHWRRRPSTAVPRLLPLCRPAGALGGEAGLRVTPVPGPRARRLPVLQGVWGSADV